LSLASSPFCSSYFWRWESRELFTQAGLKLWSSRSQVSQVARITGMNYWH
jgi:hypothetical protein